MGRCGSVRRENLSEILAGVTGSRLYGFWTPNPGFLCENPGFWYKIRDFGAKIYFPIDPFLGINSLPGPAQDVYSDRLRLPGQFKMYTLSRLRQPRQAQNVYSDRLRQPGPAQNVYSDSSQHNHGGPSVDMKLLIPKGFAPCRPKKLKF